MISLPPEEYAGYEYRNKNSLLKNGENHVETVHIRKDGTNTGRDSRHHHQTG